MKINLKIEFFVAYIQNQKDYHAYKLNWWKSN